MPKGERMDLVVGFPQHDSPRNVPLRTVSFASHSKCILVDNLGHEHKRDLCFSKQERRSLWNATARTVSFASQFECRLVDNLSHEYKRDLWFSREEMESFKYGAAKFLRGASYTRVTFAEFAKMDAHERSAFMGLENYLLLYHTFSKSEERRRAIWEAVKTEQRRQASAGVCNPRALSKICERMSKSSRKCAFVIGVVHAKESKKSEQPPGDSLLASSTVGTGEAGPQERMDKAPLSPQIDVGDPRAISIVTE